MNYDFDAVIIGGGPSGATCALYAERLGLNVLLVDKKTFPRDKICGDAISGKSVRYLQELGLHKALEKQPQVRANGVTFSAPNGVLATVSFTPPNAERESYGYVCRREVFDNLLFQHAKERVATRENFSINDVILENNRVRGVVGKNGGGEVEEITAKIVIAADGYNSVLLRKLNLYDHDPKHWVVATRAYYRGVKNMTDAIEIHFVKDVLPGYFWIFPLEDDKVNVGIGMLHSELKKRKISLRKAHVAATKSDFFRERFKDAKMLGGISGWNLPVGSKKRPTHGDGFMILGDAAGLIDPFSGEGIGNGMCSGKIAAETLAQACKTEDFSASALSIYGERLWETLGPELRQSYALQRIGRFRPLLNLVVDRAAKHQEVRDWISMMMAGTAPKEALKSPMTYIRLLFMNPKSNGRLPSNASLASDVQ